MVKFLLTAILVSAVAMPLQARTGEYDQIIINDVVRSENDVRAVKVTVFLRDSVTGDESPDAFTFEVPARNENNVNSVINRIKNICRGINRGWGVDIELFEPFLDTPIDL
jgi:hypothetical protein